VKNAIKRIEKGNKMTEVLSGIWVTRKISANGTRENSKFTNPAPFIEITNDVLGRYILLNKSLPNIVALSENCEVCIKKFQATRFVIMNAGYPPRIAKSRENTTDRIIIVPSGLSMVHNIPRDDRL